MGALPRETGRGGGGTGSRGDAQWLYRNAVGCGGKRVSPAGDGRARTSPGRRLRVPTAAAVARRAGPLPGELGPGSARPPELVGAPVTAPAAGTGPRVRRDRFLPRYQSTGARPRTGAHGSAPAFGKARERFLQCLFRTEGLSDRFVPPRRCVQALRPRWLAQEG